MLEGKMTYGQSMRLFQSLSRQFDKLETPPEKHEAHELITIIQEYKNGVVNASLLELAVQGYFPDWTISEYKGRNRKSSEKEETVSAQIEQAKEVLAEVQETIAEVKALSTDDDDDEVKKAQEALERAIAEKERKRAEKELEEEKRRLAEEAAKAPKLPPTLPTSTDYIRPSNFDLVALLVGARENLLLIGPAGCGKTRMMKEVAKSLGKELFTFSFAGGLRQAQIFGSTQLSEGKTEWKPSKFIEAIQSPGIVFMDEIFSVDPECLQGLNGILEDREYMSPIGLLKVHEDCSLVGASNTNGRTVSPKHTGTNRVDDALISRFAKEVCTYDVKAEEQLVKAFRLGATGDALLSQWAAMRYSIESNNIMFDVSTRALLQACRYISLGIDYSKAVELSVGNSLSKAERIKLGF